MVTNEILYGMGRGKRLLEGEACYDVLISAFNLSERVSSTFEKIKAPRKYWIIHNEYRFEGGELPGNGELLISSESDEADFIIDALSKIKPNLASNQRICIDITGFMRPHLMFLMRYLQAMQIYEFDLVYAEPSQYRKKADTVFSSDVVGVRQINGFEGIHTVDMTHDVLVVGAGYDHDLVSHAIAYKSGAKLIQLLSLPSLSADMYQESLLRLHRVADAPFRVPDEQLSYSSANDPFITYLVLMDAIGKLNQRQKSISNLYLSPLATKPQAVGFAMFYLRHLMGAPASIIFPFAAKYSKETSVGVGRAWVYPIDVRA
ncbi:hypothetical protein QZM46_23520 [Burkholderia vietnamiensis]|uniref:hypothetical protein n=1 Tax=Burkholderia vietnamiensis TaxID=60552 RepID=UPI002653013A|nr:hypothetical protein [Burkholderia vietnamiensis]MDN7554288.1 hypothetical protein [Burkholderia vietnamiensis]HDR9091996.1 hypothetical protein [Burkholderia vietnamiensis]